MSTTEKQQSISAAERLRALWALGDYAAVAAEVIPDLGARLVEACGIEPGHRVLDVAAGTGNAAIPAALAGAAVVACDLTPELLEAGRAAAAERGAELEWWEGDAEAMAFDDGAFDAVLSCVGVMFAPDHVAAADELLRVCAPGGVVGLVSWTPEGFVGQMLATVKPYLPPTPAGARSPAWWGSEDYVRELLGDRVIDVVVSRESVRVDRFATPEAFREYFKAYYGPTVAAYRGLAEAPERAAALDDELAELARRHDVGDSSTVMDWEYLLLTARRAG